MLQELSPLLLWNGKHVGWADTDGSSSSMRETGEELGSDEDNPIILAAYKGKDQAEIKPTSCLLETMNMSPLRRPHIPLTALQVSPLRSSPLRVTTGGRDSTESGGAQELLRAVVKDVMYEYRQETREDIKGMAFSFLVVCIAAWLSTAMTYLSPLSLCSQ
ncbi:hypothetical protein JB92DRAFT_3128590 [Gautieria morchelliformis]|nr:hypothetical protein JB92DRAFT_3128590 [Gautieria morchelliformis]